MPNKYIRFRCLFSSELGPENFEEVNKNGYFRPNIEPIYLFFKEYLILCKPFISLLTVA